MSEEPPSSEEPAQDKLQTMLTELLFAKGKERKALQEKITKHRQSEKGQRESHQQISKAIKPLLQEEEE